MRLQRISALSFLRAAALAPLMVPGGQESALGQAGSGVRAPGGSDSAWVVRQAREAQARFEWLRRQHLPVVWSGGGAACDEVVGRMCWYDDEPDWRPPPEPLEVEDGREELLLQLAAAAAQLPEDRWILGQRVRYLAEAGRLQEAAWLAGECDGRPLDVDRAAEGAGAGAGTGAGAERGEQAWWCAALLGFVRHTRGDFVAAESAFQRALAAMPSQRAQQWRDPALLLDREGRQALGEARGEERRRLEERIWRLADPLYLVPGNDRRTEHYARHVLALLGEGARNPYGIPWGEDLRELLLRYGREVGFERARPGPGAPGPERIVGHHDPGSRGYMPPGRVVRRPAGIAPGGWVTGWRRLRSLYAPAYAPDMPLLETQVARFRRGDSLLVVAAYRFPPAAETAYSGKIPGPWRRLAPPVPAPSPSAEFTPSPSTLRGAGSADGLRANPVGGLGMTATASGHAERDVEAGLFLVPAGGSGEPHETRLEGRDAGVLQLRAPAGSYVISVEALDRAGPRAARMRHGLEQLRLPPEVAALSDLLVLNPGLPLPGALGEALPRALAALEAPASGGVAVAWEVYGLRPWADIVAYRLTLSREAEGLLSRAGRLLRLVGPRRPAVELAWTEEMPAGRDPAFRAVDLEIPPLAAGEYELRLELRMPGRSVLHARRILRVSSPSGS